MASGDFADLAGQACRSAQLDPSDSLDLAQAKVKVNEAYLSCLHTGDPWDFLEVEGQWDTVAGSDKYTYASIATAASITGATIREIDTLVNDTTGYVLHSTSWQHLEQLAYSTKESAEGQGQPNYWAKWGSQNAPTIRLYPNPDAAYRMGFIAYLTPSELSADGDLPILPGAWRHRIIVPYAAALLLEQEGGNEAGAQYERLMRRHDDAMMKMRAAHATAKSPTFNVIQPGFFERRDADFSFGYEL